MCVCVNNILSSHILNCGNCLCAHPHTRSEPQSFLFQGVTGSLSHGQSPDCEDNPSTHSTVSVLTICGALRILRGYVGGACLSFNRCTDSQITRVIKSRKWTECVWHTMSFMDKNQNSPAKYYGRVNEWSIALHGCRILYTRPILRRIERNS